MRPIHEIVEEFQSRGISVWTEGERLRYRAPQGALSDALREEIAHRKSDIMKYLSSKDAAPVVAPDVARRHEPFPLTEIQQAYWVGRSGAYDFGGVGVHGYIEIETTMDPERLTDSWNRVISRHEMLRAVVLPSGEQRILKDVPRYEIELTDLRGLGIVEARAFRESVRDEMSHQVLPVDRWPLFDIRATRVADDHVLLHVSLDLLMADLWSLFIVFQDWADLANNAGQRLQPLELSFRDFVLAEREFRKTAAYRRAEKYWHDRLDQLPLGPDLPLAAPTGAQRRPQFSRFDARLDAEAWQSLRDRARRHGLTPSGVLLAAYAEILGRWSRNPEFNVNMTLFNRPDVHPQINRIVGDFTTTILLAIDHRSREPFAERARRIQQQLWHDLDHRAVNAVQVLREMARRRGGLTRAAMPVVFSSALGIDSLDQGSPRLGRFGSQLGNVVHTISQTPQVWIDHQAVEQDGALLFNWDVVDGLFPPGLPDDMFRAYRDLLNRLASTDSEWSGSERAVVPAAQLAVRAEANATEHGLSQGTLHELFLEACRVNQGRTAVISARRALTYAELQDRVNRIARRLRLLGAKPNTLVAVVMEKGWEQVAGVLGVLASGAAYVPIDPDLPEERRAQLFADARVEIALTQTWVGNRLQWPRDATVLAVDDDKEWEAQDSGAIDIVQGPDDLAYVIYTSGSTGKPKGVMIDHRGAVNTVLDINERFGVSAQDRVLALSALSFDLSVYDIFGLLGAGGAIVMPDAKTQKDVAGWARLMHEHRVTVWNTVPALMQILVEFLSCGERKPDIGLRLALLSGDWIPLNLPTTVKAYWPSVQLISLGGATEASIWSIFYPINSLDESWRSIPYGKPLRNQSFHVLNHTLDTCPDLVPGDLYIGGQGLAKGYWLDGEKTAQRFITHPVGGARLYKTGDLGRYLPDGNIEFLGREDFQVKINGFRVELGDVEAALRQHPTLKDAVVTAFGANGEARKLAAYAVCRNAQAGADSDGLKPPVKSLNAVEKIEFKLAQKGVRAIEHGQACVPLQKPAFDDSLRNRYLRLRAYRDFLPAPLAFDRFSELLTCLLQMTLAEGPLPKYRYPSAGSLYPVQTYLYIKTGRVAGVEPGAYYYHPADHVLVRLAVSEDVDERVDAAFGGPNRAIFDAAGFALFSVGELRAVEPLYGEWAKDFCFLEAGYIGQLLMDEAPRLEIGLCPIGKVELETLRSVFGWHDSQLFLQGFVGGGIARDNITKLNFARPRATPSVDELRVFLQAKLPDYMVPQHYMFLDSLPLGANGKVNRKALPELHARDLRHETEQALPASDAEKRIADITAQVLDVERVGLNSNLFDLGADSVAIVRLNSRLVAEFNCEIPVVDMFRYPTVRHLASLLNEQAGNITEQITQQRADKIHEARSRRARLKRDLVD